MKKTLTLFALIIAFAISACVPQVVETPALPTMEPTQVAVLESPAITEAPVTESTATDVPASTDPAGMKTYSNSEFGLSFQFPVDWFGPEEYISEQSLRVEVGSDQVYPYGTDPSLRIYELKNSYSVLLQYSKDNQDQYWRDLYQSLIALQDGESISDARGMLIRVRQFNLGRFEGIEYISTLSETAQTDPAYTRSVILLDPQSGALLTVLGQPINVEVNADQNWRDVYSSIDQANQAIFQQIVNSITVQ
jgi:predicted secreted protein